MQPALTLAAVPDSVFGTKHPPASFAIQDREVSDGNAERSCLECPHAALLDEAPVSQLGFRERIDCHEVSMSEPPV